LLSENQEFPNSLYLFLNELIKLLIKRIKKISLDDLIINKLVDEVIKHKRLFRVTKSKLEYKIHTDEEMILMFFNVERKTERTYSHEKVCLNHDSLQEFLSRICDIIQFNLFPTKSFQNETFCLLTKDLFLKLLLMPVLETFSEPDFLNRIIILLLKSNLPSTETFIWVLQSTDDVNELRSVMESVDQEILFVRSRDHEDDESKMKQQLQSLLYLKRIIQSNLKKFDESDCDSVIDQQTELTPSLSSSSSSSSKISDQFENRISISFETILRHDFALEYFIEYMSNIGSDNYVSVEQGLFDIYLSSITDTSVPSEQYQQLQTVIRETALSIYDTYLGDANKRTYLKLVDRNHCKQLHQNLMSDDPSLWLNECLFDDILWNVKDLLKNREEFFPSFKKSKYYRKLLGEPDLLRDSLDDEAEIGSDQIDFRCPDLKNGGKEDNENEKSQSNRRQSFNVEIIDTGILNLQGKSFIGYLINVEQKNGENWTILRRYSEFFSFHQSMLDKCEKYRLNLKNILYLPPKTVLSNRMNENFVQYRKQMLNIYLKRLNYLHEKFSFLHGHQAMGSKQIRKENCFRRRVAAKVLILTFLSDLKKLIGNDTLQTGLISFFEIFQNKTLNMRLILVLFEILLKELFPESNFEVIFERLYNLFDDRNLKDESHPLSPSSRSSSSISATTSNQKSWPPYLK
ncbi:sorting nexin-like protein 5, partial [Sarcoptes scabiei]